MKIEFKQITCGDKEQISALSQLASAIVKEHFDPIIGAAQNDYMISKFQTVEAVTEQFSHGYQYYFVKDPDKNNIGFLAFYQRNRELYLSKFYLLKELRGKGLSRQMLDFVISEAKKRGLRSVVLNVNRNNSAILAYEKLGFQKTGEEVNDIGNGFVMDDYVYEYQIV